MTFAQSLQFGKTGESAIAWYMKARGNHILPVYEKQVNDYKGPAIYLSDGGFLVAPDMLLLGKKTMWIEAKHKTAFTWHRISQKWTTGIDLHHFNDYLKVAEKSNWPVWLLFLHENGTAKDTPEGMVSPTGLFGNDLSVLKARINHTHQNHGKHGMVYWAVDSLKRIATLEELKQMQKEAA